MRAKDHFNELDDIRKSISDDIVEVMDYFEVLLLRKPCRVQIHQSHHTINSFEVTRVQFLDDRDLYVFCEEQFFNINDITIESLCHLLESMQDTKDYLDFYTIK